MLLLPVEGEALQVLDCERLLHETAVALGLAGVVADPAADHRQRVPHPNQLGGFPEAPLGDERHVTGGLLADRAGLAAGRALLLVDQVGVRHGLREGLVDGRALLEHQVEGVGHLDRAHLLARLAGGALVGDVAGLLPNLYLEVPREAR